MGIEEQANRSSLLTKAVVDEFSRRGFEKSARGGYVSIQVYSLDSIPIDSVKLLCVKTDKQGRSD